MKSRSTPACGYAKLLCIFVVALCSLAVPTHAATFHGLGTLAGGNYSFGIALSGDGNVAVGNATAPDGASFDRRSFRWTEATGMQSLGSIDDTNIGGTFRDEVHGVSSDGSLVIGMLNTLHVYVWSQSSGCQQLPNAGVQDQDTTWTYGISSNASMIVANQKDDGGRIHSICWTNMNGPFPLFDDGGQYSTAIAVSDDGSTVTGSISPYQQYTYRWTAASGAQLLTNDGGVFQGSWPQGMSRDGSVIVGVAYSENLNHEEMYRWTADTGLVGLGIVSGDANSEGFGVSNDGNTIVGGAGPSFNGQDGDTTTALIWRPQWGLRHLIDVLTNDYHLDLNGWQLTSARAVSTNGTVILGNGINPSGQQEAWIATIEPVVATQPPPLSIHVDNTNCVLTWATNVVGFALQQSSDGSLTNWTAVPIPPAVVGNQFAVTNPVTTTSAYFRLRN